jgi:two-component system, chemotaxis family, chemotaxis protein CheY
VHVGELIPLLRPIEQEACALYAMLAGAFATPPELSRFLQTLSRDEATHLKLLESAERLLPASGTPAEASLQFGPDDSRRMLEKFGVLRERLAGGQLNETQLLEAIIDAEFSEWNEVFLYVTAHFRGLAPSFQHLVSIVQQHHRHIAEYVDSRPVELRPPNAARVLPQVWEQRILVADDNDVLRLTFGEFLGRLGNVSTAADGAEALALARETFFDVIVSDVDMPGLDGLEFFDAIGAVTPEEQPRFIFVTGMSRPRLEELCAQGRARLLLKPLSLATLEETVLSVLKKED